MKKTKDYLNRLYFMNEEITRLKAYLEEVKQRSEAKEKTTAIEERIKNKAAEYLELSSKIRELIGKMTDLRERRVLIHRYLFFETWKEIAGRLWYSESYIFRLHNKALSNFKELRNKNDN